MKQVALVSALCLSLVIIGVSSAHAAWIPDGVLLAPAPEPNASAPRIIPDGSGGAVITWMDYRGGNYDIYARRVSNGGEPMWMGDGVAICSAANSQYDPQLASDGNAGAIVAWADNRAGSQYDIYAQRVDYNGVVRWTANGVAICAATNNQTRVQIASDGSGGAIITWEDYRSGSYSDIYAQRMNASGAVQWTANGVAICTAAYSEQYSPQIIPDGSGGAIITWWDRRGGTFDIYAQRVNASGVVQWTANGVALCTAASDQYHPQLTSDGSGGAIVTWYDYRNGSTSDVYAQRVNASGVAQWTANGVAICTATNTQINVQIASDGSGGAIITWEDWRVTAHHVYAQRVNASGVAQWTADGVVLCAAYQTEDYPQIASDGSGGAIITWQDFQGGSPPDIYAQRVNASGAVQWTANGVALCSAANFQGNPQITSDGSGGAVITWEDERGGNQSHYDISAQRVNASGAVQWTVDGADVCSVVSDQQNPRLTSDGSSGAIVTWQDYRSGTPCDIYAQRVNASGAAQWAAAGVAICTAANYQYNPQIASDGSGGAVITWRDYRGGTGDIYAQRVNASGAAQWTANGVAICTAANDQTNVQIAPDGSGGVIVTWEDSRGGTYSDIYAQRVSASGAVQWTANGVAICTAASAQGYPQIVPDGSGGVIVTWQDFRTGSTYDIYAQRVNASGAVQWTANGVALSTAVSNQLYPQITSDGSGGAIITWHDFRGGSTTDIYAQRVNASGAVQWTADGVPLCTAANNQQYPQLISDGSGGAIVTWQDYRGGSYYDIYAQRVNASGAAQWTANGLALCTSANSQQYPQIASDGSGGAMITWHDFRGGSTSDIYAQWVNASGIVQWTADGIGLCAAQANQQNPQLTSDGSGGAIVAWEDGRSGVKNIYAQRTTDLGLGPICRVEPTTIALPGAAPAGGSRDTSFVITNDGIGSLLANANEVCDQFRIVSGGGSFVLSNGQSRVVTVRFEPTSPGVHNCTIETGVYVCGDVSITGTATELPPDSVIYVDADATGAGGGSSWANAFTNLQDALALAPSCPGVTEIWVAEGTYRPTTGTDRTATFQLLDNLAIYGGFAGMEGVRSQRNVHTHVTTLSGDIGTPGDASDNSYHVVTASYTDTTAVLNGFTVTGGKANGAVENQQWGAGIFDQTGSPKIANVELRGNEAQAIAGGMLNVNGSPKMVNVVFRENKSATGGGMFNNGGGSPVLMNVLFIGNRAEIGGGIYNLSSLSLVNASFFGNVASVAGGGGCYNTTGNPVITNTIMWGDSAHCSVGHEDCAEIYKGGGNPTISYSIVQRSGGSSGWDASLGTDGGHNIDADPLYYGAEAGDLRILVGSPAIDAGKSAVSGLPPRDIAGNPRIQGAAIDMGAYEGGTAALYSYARMDSLVDVPHDQGGWLRIYFTRSSYDNPLESEYPIARYDIHRRVDDPRLLASINSAGEEIRENVTVKLPSGEKVSLTAPSSDAGSKYVRYADRYYLMNEAAAAGSAPRGTWEVVGNVSAAQQTQYIRLAPTLADSSTAIIWTVYYISAHTTTPTVHFDSPPDSAYSVDNIAPGVPTGLVVAYNTGSGNHLTWDPSGDGDFQYFKVYRGTDPDFVPAPSNMVQATAKAEWSDPAYDVGGVYYKITALDHAGNESAPASPESTTGVDDHATPHAFALYQNAPNPFNPSTTIRYDVPAAGGAVALRIYDVSGRLVRTLVNGQQAAGQKTVTWNGRDDGARGVASGVYFYRLDAGSFSQTKKMILIR